MENTDSISYDNIKYIFEEKSTFDNQLMMFLNAVQLTDIELETRYNSICTQMDKIFKEIFPRCKTYRFGSTQTGLGFKECDLDIYMDIGKTQFFIQFYYYFIIYVFILFFLIIVHILLLKVNQYMKIQVSQQMHGLCARFLKK